MVAVDVYYDVALRQLDEQLERINSLDAKAATCLVFAGAILPAWGALLVFAKVHPPHSTLFIYAAAAAAFLILLFFAYRAFDVRSWDKRPDLETLKAHSVSPDFQEDGMRLWVANESVTSIGHNEPILRAKAKMLRRAMLFLGLEALLLAAALLSALW